MKNKGFTLIELLAVILILGVIALIAIPQVSKVIEQSKKGSIETSNNNYIRAVNNKVISSRMDSDKDNDIVDGVYDISTLEGIEITGKAPTSGRVVVKNGRVDSADLITDDYTSLCNSDGKCTSEKGSYVYYIKVWPEITDTLNGASTLSERPLDKMVYIKIKVEGSTIKEKTVCVYDNGEICLGMDTFEKTSKKLLDIFEYDEHTWIRENPSGAKWYKSQSDNKIICYISSGNTKCINEKYSISIVPDDDNNGEIYMRELSTNFTCGYKMNNRNNCWTEEG